MLLVVAITIHNIPEGLAIGVSFGAAGAGLSTATLGGAIALAIGIGLQNAPEGSAISLPLRGDGLSPVEGLVVRPVVGRRRTGGRGHRRRGRDAACARSCPTRLPSPPAP